MVCVHVCLCVWALAIQFMQVSIKPTHERDYKSFHACEMWRQAKTFYLLKRNHLTVHTELLVNRSKKPSKSGGAQQKEQ